MISTAVVSSPLIQVGTTINSGTAGTLSSIPDTWTIQNVPASVAPNPTVSLIFNHAAGSNQGFPNVEFMAGNLFVARSSTTGLITFGNIASGGASLDYGVNGSAFTLNRATNIQGALTDTTSISGALYQTSTNCSSGASPAVCSAAAAGSVAVPAGTNSTLVVQTTAVTANSTIIVQSDDTLGTKLSVTCNTTLASLIVEPVVTARSAEVVSRSRSPVRRRPTPCVLATSL